MKSIDLEEVVEDTKKKTSKHPAPPSRKIMFYDIEKRNMKYKHMIKIVKNDSLSCAVKLAAHYKVCVLNFANGNIPCGGYKWIGHTQEEDIFRRTNISSTLVKDLYPYENSVVLSPEIKIIKNRTYRDIKPLSIGIISAAALTTPPQKILMDMDLNGDMDKYIYTNDDDAEHMDKKIRLILQLSEGYDVLITGAWGCGAFCNPEYGLINLWNKNIPLYSTKYIIFAIPDIYNHQIFSKYLKI